MHKNIVYKIIAIFTLSLFATLSYAVDTSDSYKDCEKTAYNQDDFLQCMNIEIKRQDKRLNKNYKTAIHSIEKFRRKELQNIQRIWIKYRDAKCSFYHHKHSGSGGVMDATQCVMEETIKRADELKYVH